MRPSPSATLSRVDDGLRERFSASRSTRRADEQIVVVVQEWGGLSATTICRIMSVASWVTWSPNWLSNLPHLDHERPRGAQVIYPRQSHERKVGCASMRVTCLVLCAFASCSAPEVEAFRYSLEWPPMSEHVRGGSRWAYLVDAVWLPSERIRCVVLPPVLAHGPRRAIAEHCEAPDLKNAERVWLAKTLRDRIIALANCMAEEGLADALVSAGVVRNDPDLEQSRRL